MRETATIQLAGAINDKFKMHIDGDTLTTISEAWDTQPTTGTQCSSMSMPAGQADAAAANPLTRAGQIGAAGNAPASSGSGAMDCQAVGHG
jgi:hypothetical protein